jgi:hypothetical protein
MQVLLLHVTQVQPLAGGCSTTTACDRRSERRAAVNWVPQSITEYIGPVRMDIEIMSSTR